MNYDRAQFSFMVSPERWTEIKTSGISTIRENGATMIYYSGDYPVNLNNEKTERYLWFEDGFQFMSPDGVYETQINPLWTREQMKEAFLVFVGKNSKKGKKDRLWILVDVSSDKAFGSADLLINCMGDVIDLQDWTDSGLLNWRNPGRKNLM